MSVEGLQNVELTDETKEETKEEKEVATKVPEAAEKYVGWDAWIHYEKTRDYRRHYVWGKGDAVGVYGRAKYVGYRVLDAMDFGGEVLCDFFGITSSKYQYEIDAGKRMLERKKMAEEEEQRRLDQMDEDQLKALEEGMAAMEQASADAEEKKTVAQP